MKIVTPYAKMLWPSRQAGAALSQIEIAARVSHRSEEDITEASAERLLRIITLRKGDWSVVEHVAATVEMVVDRGITHEIVRHRIASYTQESTRFVNYVKKMPPSFIYPRVGVRCEHCLSGNEPIPPQKNSRTEPWTHLYNEPHLVDGNCSYDSCWLTAIQNSEDDYRNLLDMGWRTQEARSVFPTALAAKIIVTMNLRSWRHYFLMRTTKEAHPQIRQVTEPLLEEFKKQIPVFYEDIEPGMSQAANMAKGR